MRLGVLEKTELLPFNHLRETFLALHQQIVDASHPPEESLVESSRANVFRWHEVEGIH